MSFEFVAIDFETANSSRASACSIGLVRFRDGKVVEQKSKLFLPPQGYDHFDAWNTQIHGISARDVKGLPRFGDLWREFEEFIGDRLLVAHNASFDMSVLRASLTASDIPWPTIQYACTMVLSRTIFDLTSNSLPFVAEAAGIEWSDAQHHDAEYDAQICGQILVSMLKLNGSQSIYEVLERNNLRVGRITNSDYTACGSTLSKKSGGSWDYKPPLASSYRVNQEANELNPIYGKLIAFTGSLHQFARPEAMELIANLGAYPQDAVTKSTDILVVGEQDPQKLKPGESQSSKFRKAEKLRASGQNIEVMTERDFLSFLEIDIP